MYKYTRTEIYCVKVCKCVFEIHCDVGQWILFFDCMSVYLFICRPRWLSWMRRPTGDQEVAGSVPAEVDNILSW